MVARGAAPPPAPRGSSWVVAYRGAEDRHWTIGLAYGLTGPVAARRYAELHGIDGEVRAIDLDTVPPGPPPHQPAGPAPTRA